MWYGRHQHWTVQRSQGPTAATVARRAVGHNPLVLTSKLTRLRNRDEGRSWLLSSKPANPLPERQGGRARLVVLARETVRKRRGNLASQVFNAQCARPRSDRDVPIVHDLVSDHRYSCQGRVMSGLVRIKKKLFLLHGRRCTSITNNYNKTPSWWCQKVWFAALRVGMGHQIEACCETVVHRMQFLCPRLLRMWRQHEHDAQRWGPQTFSSGCMRAAFGLWRSSRNKSGANHTAPTFQCHCQDHHVDGGQTVLNVCVRD